MFTILVDNSFFKMIIIFIMIFNSIMINSNENSISFNVSGIPDQEFNLLFNNETEFIEYAQNNNLDGDGSSDNPYILMDIEFYSVKCFQLLYSDLHIIIRNCTFYEKENPYYAFLATADVIVVTGESESMLAEAASTDKPLYIYPIPKVNSSTFRKQFKVYCTKCAYAHFAHKGGRKFLTRCIDTAFGWFMIFFGLVPQRDIYILHEALYSSGRAYPFGSPLTTRVHEPVHEAPDVSRWIKSIIIEYSSCLKNS